MSDSADTRITELLDRLESTRVATNIIVACALLGSAARFGLPFLPWQAAVASVPALGTAPVLTVLLPIVAIAASLLAYSLANIATRVTVGAGRGALRTVQARMAAGRAERARIADRSEDARATAVRVDEEHRKRAGELAARAERQRILLPHLTTEQLQLLGALFLAPEHRHAFPDVNIPPDVVASLLSHGLVDSPTPITASTTLYQLNAEAVPVIAEFFEANRQRAEQNTRERAAVGIREVGAEGLPILALFGMPAPTGPDEPEHPFIKADAARTIESYVEAGVLLRSYETGYATTMRRSRYVVEIPPAVVPLVASTIGGPVLRTRIVLDRSRIEAAVDSGSGLR